MTKFMFWNVHRKPFIENDGSGSLRLERLQELISSEGVDVLVLCEFVDDSAHQFAAEMSSKLREEFKYHPSPAEGSSTYLFSRLQKGALRHTNQDSYDYESHILAFKDLEILLVSLHINSKMKASPQDQYKYACDISEEIRKLESKLGHQNTIVVGDFNMNPFECGLVDERGFNAVMDRRIALKGTRNCHQKSYPYFYNPMWNCFGDDLPGSPGTYYYDKNNSEGVCYFWNIFDQVLLRPALLPYFKEGGVRILHSTGKVSLLEPEKRTPDRAIASDHLPLVFQLDL